MSIGTILLIILIIALVGGLPTGFYGGGLYVGGGLGLVLIILVLLILLGRI